MEKLSKAQKIFWRLYYYIFVERFNKKLTFDFERNIYRWDLFEQLHKKYNFQTYLEIGCDKDQLFSKVDISEKVGVDPYSGGNVRKTSDDFFKENTKNFDFIFIDGLHEYNQVKKDILNSLTFLNNNGFILVHDCLPSTLSSQAVPRYKMVWHGDVWKAIVDLRRDKNIDIHTCLVDTGIAIIQKKSNTQTLELNKNIKDLKFRDFYENHKNYMRIISYKEFKEMF